MLWVEGLYVVRIESEDGKKRLVYPAYTMHGYETPEDARAAFYDRLYHESVRNHGIRPVEYDCEPISDEALIRARQWAGMRPLPKINTLV